MENNIFISNDNKLKNKSEWTTEQEMLLAEWAEKAACYRWLHSKSEKVYTSNHYNFSIPIIILSTLTGTANFGIESVPDKYKRYTQMGIGGVNLFAGILGTLQSFFRYAELMEAHRNVEILWSKFQREITVELALAPRRRKEADKFLAVSRAQFDKLIEQSPPIPDKIINLFKTTFKKTTNIHKPDICNGIDPCNIYNPIKKNSSSKLNIESKKSKFDKARKNLSMELASNVNQYLNNKKISPIKDNVFKKLDNKSKTNDFCINKEENIVDNDIENP